MNIASYKAMSDPLSELVANIRAKRLAEAQQEFAANRDVNQRALERELIDRRLQKELEMQKAMGDRQLSIEEMKLKNDLAMLDKKAQSVKVSKFDPTTGDMVEFWVPKSEYESRLPNKNTGIDNTTQETPAQKAIRLARERRMTEDEKLKSQNNNNRQFLGTGGMPIK